MRPRIGQGHCCCGMAQEIDDAILVDIEQQALEFRHQIVSETEIEEPVPRVLTRFARELSNDLANQLFMLGFTDRHDFHVVPVVG